MIVTGESKLNKRNVMKHQKTSLVVVALLPLLLSGCWLGAGALGAEAGYVASQEERSAGETIDDQVILTSVKSKLVGDPEVSGLSINVDVFKGVVQLRGYVDSQSEIDRAILLAQETKGVSRVDSRLVLDRP
jgi:hyperosmotically inducible protein